MMRKLVSFVFVLAMLAMLAYPAWYLYKNPAMLAVTTPSQGAGLNGSLPVSMLAVSPTPSTMLAASPTPDDAGSFQVLITAESVNLRDENGKATGKYLFRGDSIEVVWFDAGSWGEIVSPSRYAGMRVWRGCTSDAGNYGCESK